MAETVLVTGGTGYVGGWAIAELLNRGYTVRTTVRARAREAVVRAWVAPVANAVERLSFFEADLTGDAGWAAAVKGCDYVWHVASPLGANSPKDPNELIVPARDGTLRVLRASLEAGVKRVVLTSSCAAINAPSGPGGTFDETKWPDLKAKGLTAYRKSKIVAERAAWDFAAKQGASDKLTTVLPAGVFGPILTAENLGSVQVISRMLKGQMPGLPRLGFCVVDVRDVVDAHMKAMTVPAAAAQRFIAAGEYMWMTDVAAVLRKQLGERAKNVPTRRLPNFAVRLAALFGAGLRELTPGLGRKHAFSHDKAKRLLGWTPRPAQTTIVDCAESLFARGAA